MVNPLANGGNGEAKQTVIQLVHLAITLLSSIGKKMNRHSINATGIIKVRASVI